MPITKNEEWMSVEDYLAFEERSPIRHEYVDGRIIAMTGSTQRHNVIANNINAILRNHLKGGPCRVFTIALKVHVSAANSFYYPDVVVACGKHADDSVFVAKPSLILEVLSPSTASVDRREKFIASGRFHRLVNISLSAPRENISSCTEEMRQERGMSCNLPMTTNLS